MIHRRRSCATAGPVSQEEPLAGDAGRPPIFVGSMSESLAETSLASLGGASPNRAALRVVRRPNREEHLMAPLFIGYARVSTDEQDHDRPA